MSEASNAFIRQALDMARQLTILADEGESASKDDGCIVLYGVIRDCAYQIKSRAERERERHKMEGIWVDESAPINSVRNG